MATSTPLESKDGYPAPRLAHHFDTLSQQEESLRLGLWIFLVTEVFFFVILFATFFVYRHVNEPGFAAATKLLNTKLGTTNTFVLLTSSLFMALGLGAAQRGQRKRCTTFLLGTIVLSFVFLGIKSVEYTADWHEHVVPGKYFAFEGHPVPMAMHEYGVSTPPPAVAHEGRVKEGAELFFLLYFVMTIIHGIHILVGIGIIGFVAYRSWKGRYSPTQHTGVELASLYWHFVDIVWVFLFPMFYLLDLVKK